MPRTVVLVGTVLVWPGLRPFVAQSYPAAVEGSYVARDFKFASGERVTS